MKKQEALNNKYALKRVLHKLTSESIDLENSPELILSQEEIDSGNLEARVDNIKTQLKEVYEEIEVIDTLFRS